MREKVEFGCFRENEVAFRRAKSLLGHATDNESLDRAITLLARLREHIVSTNEQKSCSMLLPKIDLILKDPGAYAKVLNGRRVSRASPSSRHSKSTDSSQGLRPLARWLRQLSNSFLRQWSFLCRDFLLVLSVLGFSVSINAFLRLFQMESRSYIVPIIRVTDICLIGVFCAECLILLILTAIREIHQQVRSLQANTGGGTNPGAASSMSSNPALSAFQRANAEQVNSLQEETACGRFTRDAVEMPGAFLVLGETHKRFDAVSRDELPYWLTDPTNPLAEEYFRAGADLVRTGKNVTRIFLLSRIQMQQREILKEVLLKHLRSGIGFAVASFEHLPTNLKIRAKELDFGLWDRGNAYSVFRQQEGGYARKMGIVFGCEANADVATKVELYKELLTHVWLVDKMFADSQRDLISELASRLLKNNDHLSRLIGGGIKPEENFFLNVNGDADLSGKVDNLLALWTLAQGQKQRQPLTPEEEQENIHTADEA